jgi:molybdate transport system regulatory protein
MYISAEVKAPLVELCKGDVRPQCSAENMLQGKVLRAVAHDIAAEVVVQLDDETNLCAMITADSFDALAPQPGDMFWVFFDAFAVVLHLD